MGNRLEDLRDQSGADWHAPGESYLDHARHSLAEGNFYEAAAYSKLSDSEAQIRQAAALESIATSLNQLNFKISEIEGWAGSNAQATKRLSELVQDVYNVGPAIQVRTSQAGS
jgi:hypothetical protein